jgi:hypothetical protein
MNEHNNLNLASDVANSLDINHLAQQGIFAVSVDASSIFDADLGFPLVSVRLEYTNKKGPKIAANDLKVVSYLTKEDDLVSPEKIADKFMQELTKAPE